MVARKHRSPDYAQKRRENVRLAMQRMRAGDNDLSILPYKVSRRRQFCRLNLLRFIETYLKPWFPLPHSPDQLKTIGELQSKILNGGSKAIARPRGTGKTQQTKAAAIWAAMYRHRRYNVPFAATAKMARKNFAAIVKAIASNDKLAEDFPEICLPIRAAYRRPNKSRYITINKEPALMEVGATKLVFPHAPNLCLDAAGHRGQVLMECAGVLEAARGLQHDTPDGETLRPDLAIGDDFQTKASARSPAQCATRIETIRGDFKHMAGPNNDLTMILNATVIEKGDAADQLLDRLKHPEFEGERQRMVYEFPKDQELWKTYVELRKSGMRDGDGGKAANEFYASHRAAMDEGAVVGWEHGFSSRRGELSAIQAAYNILADDGEHVFWSECQNQPIERIVAQYELTADLVLSRLTNIPRLHAPEGCHLVIATADINFVGLNYGIYAARPDAATFLTHYGKHPENTVLIDKKRSSGLTESQAIANAIAQLAHHLNETKVIIGTKARFVDSLFIDCGFMSETVLKTISALPRYPMKIHAIRGVASSRWKIRKDALKAGEGWQIVEWTHGIVFEINADYWREQSQRAFLLETGTPGAIGLYGSSPTDLQRYADEVTAEKLIERVDTARGKYYQWHRRPGTANDLGDVQSYAFAALNAAGASTANSEKAWRPRAVEEIPAPSAPPTGHVRKWKKPSRTVRHRSGDLQ